MPSRFLHVLRGHAVDITAEFCDDTQEAIHRILAQWTDQGGLTAGQQRIVELPIEHGGLGLSAGQEPGSDCPPLGPGITS